MIKKMINPVWGRHRFVPRQKSRPDIGDLVKETLEDVIYTWIDKHGFWEIRINSGLIHDGGSVPRIAWTISGLTPHGQGAVGYLVHDVLYRTLGGRVVDPEINPMRIRLNAQDIHVSRRCADDIMLAGMIWAFSKKDRWRARMAYNTVRLFGKRHWGGLCPSCV